MTRAQGGSRLRPFMLLARLASGVSGGNPTDGRGVAAGRFGLPKRGSGRPASLSAL